MEASGAVGPEPITSRSSPITSESSSDSTVGRRGQARQLPALDARNVLANGVDLVDVGAAGQQQLGGPSGTSGQGAYTAEVTSADNTSAGVALVEVYNVP